MLSCSHGTFKFMHKLDERLSSVEQQVKRYSNETQIDSSLQRAPKETSNKILLNPDKSLKQLAEEFSNFNHIIQQRAIVRRQNGFQSLKRHHQTKRYEETMKVCPDLSDEVKTFRIVSINCMMFNAAPNMCSIPNFTVRVREFSHPDCARHLRVSVFLWDPGGIFLLLFDLVIVIIIRYNHRDITFAK